METWFVAFLLTLVRTAALIAVFPMFSGRNMPHLVKIGLVVVITGTLSTMAGNLADIPPGMWSSWVWWAFAVARETLVGGTLGVLFGLLLLPAQIAGAYFAQEMGLTMASVTDPSSGSSVSVPSQMLSVLGTLLFFGLNLHHHLIRVLAFSFETRPVGADWSLPSPLCVLAGMADAHEAGLLIAAPAGIVLFAALVVILITMRVAQQFNLFSYGLAIRVGVGLLTAILFLPEMCQLINRMYLRLATRLAV